MNNGAVSAQSLEPMGHAFGGDILQGSGNVDYKIRLKKPKVYKQQKRRFQNIHSRAWNDRFSVTCSKDNEKYHCFYKEFFDKPVKRKIEHVTFIPKPQDPDVIKTLK